MAQPTTSLLRASSFYYREITAQREAQSLKIAKGSASTPGWGNQKCGVQRTEGKSFLQVAIKVAGLCAGGWASDVTKRKAGRHLLESGPSAGVSTET